MKISSNGLDLIKEFEGLRLTAYLCAANVPTIGYGHTGKDVTRQDVGKKKITLQEAHNLLLQDVERFERAVDSLVTKEITQNQFDALVSFAYNIGEAGLAKSSVLRKLNVNPWDPTITASFALWNKGGGKVLKALVSRRAKEAQLYFKK